VGQAVYYVVLNCSSNRAYCLIPLIWWFCIGNQTAIFIVFMGVFFILTIATIKAIETVPEHLINALHWAQAPQYGGT
jgi:ABC-type nitrate/sulfonate/bicarbonate transport system permease component